MEEGDPNGSERKKSKKVGLVLNITIVIGFFVFFLGMSIFGITKFIGSTEEEIIDKDSNMYQYFQYDPVKKESNYGFLSIFEEIEEGGYLSYIDSKGRHNLISNFGTDEYMCTGRCVCEGDNSIPRRASTTSKAVTSLILLVASMSSYIAYDRAKEHFLEECSSNDECLISASISSSFGSGSGIGKTNDQIRDDVDIKVIVEECEKISKFVEGYQSEEKVYQGENFMCKGNCKTNDRHSMYEARLMAKLFECERLETEGGVTVSTKDLTEVQIYDKARLRFQKEFLVPYCRMISRKTVFFLNEYGDEEQVIRSLCTGDGIEYFNPRIASDVWIVCRKTHETEYPPPPVPTHANPILDDDEVFHDDDEDDEDAEDAEEEEFVE